MSLLKQLFGKKSTTETDIGRPCPGMRVAVVGDIHGCVDLLDRMIERLEGMADVVVTVGDYVDRGEHSAAVLDRLRSHQTDQPDRFACLKGNHEKMMLDFLDRPEERGARWLRNGGLQTLASYGIGGVTEASRPADMLRARDDLAAALPDEVEAWIRALPLSWSSGTLWVVHAAADPDLALTDQSERVMMWGHAEFMKRPRTDGLWVAHGHTVTDMPVQVSSRIAVDTGAYFTGRLSAALISPSGEVEFTQVMRS